MSRQKSVSIAPTRCTTPEGLEPGLEPRADPFERLVDTSVAEPAQDGDPGCRGEGVPRQRAGLVDVADGGEPLHQPARPAEGGGREAAADDLPEDREVGRHTVELLCAAAGDAETGHHLVEYQQCARRVRERAQRLEEARLGRDAPHVPPNGLDDDRREPLPVALARRSDAGDVVERAHDRVGGDAGRHAGGRGYAERHHTGAGTREEGVDVTVVAAGELDHAVAAGHGPCEPERAHRRFGTRAHEPHHLDGRHSVDDLGCELDLGLGRRAERRASIDRVVDRRRRLGVRVAEDQRAPGLHPVHVAVAVDVLDDGALAPAHEDRLVHSHRPHRTHGRVDASGEEVRRTAPEIGALGQRHRVAPPEGESLAPTAKRPGPSPST